MFVRIMNLVTMLLAYASEERGEQNVSLNNMSLLADAMQFRSCTCLERLTKPFDIPPTYERTGKRKEGPVDIGSSLMTDSQSTKAVYPPKGAFNDPTPSAEPSRDSTP